MVFVAFGTGDRLTIFAQLNLDTTIKRTQNTGSGFPFTLMFFRSYFGEFVWLQCRFPVTDIIVMGNVIVKSYACQALY
jgi:hypothetical protein